MLLPIWHIPTQTTANHWRWSEKGFQLRQASVSTNFLNVIVESVEIADSSSDFIDVLKLALTAVSPKKQPQILEDIDKSNSFRLRGAPSEEAFC